VSVEGVVRVESGDEPWVEVVLRVPRELLDDAGGLTPALVEAISQAIVDVANRRRGIRRLDPETGGFLS
jgi:hypothetical protein